MLALRFDTLSLALFSEDSYSIKRLYLNSCCVANLQRNSRVTSCCQLHIVQVKELSKFTASWIQ